MIFFCVISHTVVLFLKKKRGLTNKKQLYLIQCWSNVKRKKIYIILFVIKEMKKKLIYFNRN